MASKKRARKKTAPAGAEPELAPGPQGSHEAAPSASAAPGPLSAAAEPPLPSMPPPFTIPVNIAFSVASPPGMPPPSVVLPAGTTPAPRPPEGPLLLDDAIVALQKTFSRVNARTQKNREEHPDLPTALILGNVQFEMTVALAPVSKTAEARQIERARKLEKARKLAEGQMAAPLNAEALSALAKSIDEDVDNESTDTFEIAAGGPISLTFRGTLDTDVRIDERTTAAP